MPPSQPQSEAIQILATEHWSLLATRSLTYSEQLSRASMFMTVLSGAVIALALVAQADHFGQTFRLVAILMLFVVLFVGVATVARLEVLNHDDMTWVMGMNRIRHAYLKLHPELEPYFVTNRHDDFRGASVTMGFEPSTRGLGQLVHGFQTLPGMVSVIAAVVAGALGALIAAVLGLPTALVVAVAIGAFLITNTTLGVWGLVSFLRFRTSRTVLFPSEESLKKQ